MLGFETSIPTIGQEAWSLPHWSLLYLISEWVIRLAMLFYVPQRRTPAAARSWLLLIFIFPWGGLALYSIFGRAWLPRKRLELQQTVSATIRRAGHQESVRAFVVHPELPPQFLQAIKLAENLGDFPIVGGNEVEFIPNYGAAIDRIVEDIHKAERFVHLLYYIFYDDLTGNRVADALIAAHQRGVACRLLVNSLGSKPARAKLIPRLRGAGIEVTEVLPVHFFRRHQPRPDLRNHRKIVVIDGAIGYVGSQNIVDADFKPGMVYEELVARMTGPVVLQLQAVFVADRYFETGDLLAGRQYFPLPGTDVVSPELQAAGDDSSATAVGATAGPSGSVPSSTGVPSSAWADPSPEASALAVSTGVPAQIVPSGPGYPQANNERMMVTLIHAAQRRVAITTPYFIPDEPLLEALETAAMRGVEVHLVVSKIVDQFLVGFAQRSYYEDLLSAGVKIHEYRPKFLHSKHLSIDDEVCLIGSSNVDIRSFQLNAEISVLMYDADTVAKLRQVEHHEIRHSDLITHEQWQQRSILTRLFQNMARMVDSVL